MAGCVVAYALSPIDLIPDFIPVIGYLDDLLIVPLGIMATVKLIPKELMLEFHEEAGRRKDKPTSYAVAAFIIVLWIAATALAFWWLWPRLNFATAACSAPDCHSSPSFFAAIRGVLLARYDLAIGGADNNLDPSNLLLATA